MLGSGGERCYRKLRGARHPLRAHSIIPPTSQSLHRASSHTRNGCVTREDHGAGSLYSGIVNQGDEGEANQWVATLGPVQYYMTDYEAEKFMKRLAGRTDLEDALQRLDVLTKEENLVIAARNLEVTHRVDANVTATQELARNIHDNVEVTNLCLSHVGTVMDEQQRLLHLCPSMTNCH